MRTRVVAAPCQETAFRPTSTAYFGDRTLVTALPIPARSRGASHRDFPFILEPPHMASRAPLFAFPLLLILGAAGPAESRLALDPPAASADELEEVMEGLDKNFEAVIAAIEKKDGPAGLELMAKLQQACISAKTLTPPKLRTVEEKDKAA